MAPSGLAEPPAVRRREAETGLASNPLRRGRGRAPLDGTLKAWTGATPFLTRTLAKVRTETSLQVLADNMKPMIRIVGVGPLMAAIRA